MKPRETGSTTTFHRIGVKYDTSDIEPFSDRQMPEVLRRSRPSGTPETTCPGSPPAVYWVPSKATMRLQSTGRVSIWKSSN